MTDSKRVFPSEEALMKVLYGVALELEDRWKRPVKDWELIRSQLEILFEGRLRFTQKLKQFRSDQGGHVLPLVHIGNGDVLYAKLNTTGTTTQR